MAVLIQYLIWEMRINKKIFSGTTLDLDYRYFLKNCFKNCRRLGLLKLNLPQELQAVLGWTS
jgi:hypothetical protein